MITLGVYLIGSGLTAATVAGGGWVVFLYATRIAGMGIGGEYAAINSAIDEMIPARYRGRVDIAVNGTYWAGSIIGTVATLFLLNHLSANLGWRLAFLIGPVLKPVHRSTLVAALMIPQSFLYNAIFFTYGLVLKFFFHVPATSVPYYFFAFAVGNLLGPLTIGRLFDTPGRKKMIAGAMILGGVAEIIFGVAAEGKSLEGIATPLSVVRKAVGSAGEAAKSPPTMRGQAT